jgi:hypothetical protein
MNIYQRINEVRKAIGYVQKDKAVSTGGGSYKAVTHDAVTGMVRAALIEHGVVIVPSVVSSVFNAKEPEAKQRLYEATFQIEFVNMDEPTDRIVTQQTAHALDNGDKAPGKAMSYATKYAILKLFNIETGEDEESRYQTEEFDIVGCVDYILASTSMAELKMRYSQRYKLAEDAKNKEAMKSIIIAKDKRKSEIDSDSKKNEMAGQA